MTPELDVVTEALCTAKLYLPEDSLQHQNCWIVLHRKESFLVGSKFKDAFSKAAVLAIIRAALAIVDQESATEILVADLQEDLNKIEAIEAVE